MSWIPVTWEREDPTKIQCGSCNNIQIHRMDSPYYEGIRYAVRDGHTCLNTDLEWEYEPSPSNRDEAFYERCRFKSFDDATNAVSTLLLKRKEGTNMCSGFGQGE